MTRRLVLYAFYSAVVQAVNFTCAYLGADRLPFATVFEQSIMALALVALAEPRK